MARALIDPPRTEGADAPTDVVRWRDDHVGLAIGAVYGVVVFALGWLRFANTWATVDLALFDQAMWRMANGRAPELTVLPENLFGDHFSPAILVLVPLYRVVATPLWLIAGQALALGLAVPAMRGLARQIGADQRLATVGTILSAPLLAAAVFDVHPVVATVPVTAAALAAGLRDDRRAVTVLGVLVILLRADAAVLLLGVAVVASPRCRNRLLVLAPIGMAVGVVVPVLLHSEQTFTRYWGHLGDSPADAALHPWRLVPAVFSTSLVATALIWLLPVGLLTLVKPRWALATAVAGLPILLSSYPTTSLPQYHHAATYVPFVLGGALAAVADDRIRWARPATLVGGLVLALLVASPLSPRESGSTSVVDVVRPLGVDGLHEAVAEIRPEDAVAAPLWAVPRLSHRDGTYVLEMLLDESDPVAALAPVDVAIASEESADRLRELGWETEPVSDDLVIARRATG